MKNRFLFLFILSSFTLWCQPTIKGAIYDKNGVLENVAVYLNNTMFGTTTDVKGEFELKVKEGQYELIVSYLGYKKIVYSLNTSNYTKPLTFVLEEEENILDEIEVIGEKTEIDNLDNIESSKEIIELSWNQDNLDEPVNGVVSAYLKLHLLSYKFVKPNSINLDGLFSSLPNIAWTNQGPVSLDEIDEKLLESKNSSDNLYIRSLDKFPCLTDYIIPKNVRIADASRVRLGAYLSSGTTVMHEGFVNFNAGTLGKAMIEGRISAGVVIGDNSDLGGGCSTMGTLSGGNDIKISVGKNCLLGANSGIGIPLGDNCTVEAGLYITSGTKIQLHDTEGNPTIIKKGLELANSSDLVFLRNSINGMVIAKPNKKSIQLNTQLHTND